MFNTFAPFTVSSVTWLLVLQPEMVLMPPTHLCGDILLKALFQFPPVGLISLPYPDGQRSLNTLHCHTCHPFIQDGLDVLLDKVLVLGKAAKFFLDT